MISDEILFFLRRDHVTWGHHNFNVSWSKGWPSSRTWNCQKCLNNWPGKVHMIYTLIRSSLASVHLRLWSIQHRNLRKHSTLFSKIIIHSNGRERWSEDHLCSGAHRMDMRNVEIVNITWNNIYIVFASFPSSFHYSWIIMFQEMLSLDMLNNYRVVIFRHANKCWMYRVILVKGPPPATNKSY